MKSVQKPVYEKEILGEINRFDERDIVFARQDLFRYFGENSEQYKQYYIRHPEALSYDTAMSKKSPLGSSNIFDAPMFRAQFKLIDNLGTESMVDRAKSENRQNIHENIASQKIKNLAIFFGADIVGIGPLKQEWTYSNAGCTLGDSPGYSKWGSTIDLSSHKHAIAMGFGMDLNYLASAPKFPTLMATAQAYAESAWVAVRLAEYIRQIGYSARAHHFSNYQVLAVPIAVDCGLGELSRAGYLLNKNYGLGLRLSIVTTDLPLEHDYPVDIGVQSFCDQCRICADECPSGAISNGEKVLHNGFMKWKLDEAKCYAYWHVNCTDCGICMASCPWTKPSNLIHQTIAEIASIKGFHQGLLARVERIFYGKHRSEPPPDFILKEI